MSKTQAQQVDIPIEDLQIKRMHRLEQRVAVASISASRFSNSKSDTNRKGAIHDDTGAELDMFSFSKKLLTKSVLSRVQQHYSRARDLMRIPKKQSDGSVKFQRQRYGIAPWGNGEVLILIGTMEDMQRDFAVHDKAMKDEIKKLEPEWKGLLREAEEASGELFDADLMPSFQDFAESWGMELHITMLPPSSPVITLDDMQLRDLAEQVRDSTATQVTERLSQGWKAAAENMLMSLKYTAAVLGNDAGAVQAFNGTKGERKSKRAVPIAPTLFENLNTQIKTAKALAEAAGDTGLLNLVNKVSATLGEANPEYLRKNPTERKKLAETADKLVKVAEIQAADTAEEVATAIDELSAFG